VISSDYIGKLPLKLVVPITDWKDSFASDLWHIRLDPTDENGLTKPSAADALQARSLDTRRFIRKIAPWRVQTIRVSKREATPTKFW
jgi:mRNA interferase MazF